MSTRTIAVLTLVAIAVTATAAKPEVWSVRPGDPDNADRLYGNGDTITIVIGQPLKEVEKSVAAGVTMTKAEVDNILTFHEMGSGNVAEISIGTDYTAVWEPFNVLDKLVITVTNATGASTAVLEGFTLSVRCKVGALKLIGDTEFCDP